MNPLYVERVSQYFLSEFVRDNPMSNAPFINERNFKNKPLLHVPAREEQMAKYWDIWKALLLTMVKMSTQCTFVPEIITDEVKRCTRNILDIERAYLVATKPRYLDDSVEDCFNYIETPQSKLKINTELEHLRFLHTLTADLLCIENRYLVTAVLDLSGTKQRQTISLATFQYNVVSYNFDEIKELCETLRNINDTINQLIRGL